MWFRRKPRNRALERRHVLDVKVARSARRRLRARVATLAAGLSLGTVFAVYISWRVGEALLNHFVYDNAAFSVETIDLHTDGIIAIEQLRRWSGVKPHDNLFALDLNRVKRDLELVPAIQSVSVERVLPRTLRIRVTEREPMAQVHNCLLDADGVAMLPLESNQRSIPVQPGERYPLISGVAPADVRVGRETDSLRARTAMRFLAAFDRSAMAGAVDIARIDVAQPEVLIVRTAQGNEITFGYQDFDRQLNRWRLIHERGLQSARQIASLDLSVGDNVPLRWLDGVVAPPGSGKTKKPALYHKKKHV